jgi:hypothetical protein
VLVQNWPTTVSGQFAQSGHGGESTTDPQSTRRARESGETPDFDFLCAHTGATASFYRCQAHAAPVGVCGAGGLGLELGLGLGIWYRYMYTEHLRPFLTAPRHSLSRLSSLYNYGDSQI